MPVNDYMKCMEIILKKKKIYPTVGSDQSLQNISYLCVIANGQVSIGKKQQSECFDFCLELVS